MFKFILSLCCMVFTLLTVPCYSIDRPLISIGKYAQLFVRNRPKTHKTFHAKKTELLKREDVGHLSANISEYNFGTVMSEQTLVAEFVLANKGNEVLRIEEIGTSCGCTVPELETYTLEPGEKTLLHITFNTGKRLGKTQKKIWITISPPALPKELVLTITADVKKVICVTPEELQFEMRETVDNKTRLILESNDNIPFNVIGYTCTDQVIKPLYDANSKNCSHTILTQVNPEKLRKTPQGFIKIKTNHPKVKSITVPFNAIAPFSIYPSNKLFLGMKAGQSQNIKVKIISNFGEDFDLSNIISQNGYINILSKAKIKNGYQVDIVFAIPYDTQEKYITDFMTIGIEGYPQDTLKMHCFGRILWNQIPN